MSEWKARVSELILACDQPGLDALVLRLALHRVAGVEEEMLAVLAAAPHDVQVWWSGECNCDGHLN